MDDQNDPTEDDTPRIRPFAASLQEMDRGRTHAELSEALHELTAAVVERGKAGELSLRIKVAPLGADTTQLKVTAAIAVKLPRLDPKPSIFWADADGNLSRNDPQQLAFGELHAADNTGGATHRKDAI